MDSPLPDRLLKTALARHTNSREILMALIGFSQDAGDATNALAYATRLEQLAPDPGLAQLIEELRRQAAAPRRPLNARR